MYRFLALWGDLATMGELDDVGLPIRHQTENLRIYADQAMPILLIQGGGAVLGHIFDRSCGFPVENFDEATSGKILESRGQTLIENYWGGYIALVRGVHEGNWLTLREPSGAFPCYHMRKGAVAVMGSDPRTLASAGLLKPVPDWRNLLIHLHSADLRTEATCIAGLDELLPGHRMSLSSLEAPEICWSPWQAFSSAAWTIGRDGTAEILERVVRNCVSSWARCFDGFHLGVSGGLDSSIVAACLAGTGKPLSLYTMVTSGGDGDERQFAHALGNALGIPVSEHRYRLDRVSVGTTTSADLPRPVGGGIFLQEIAHASKSLANASPANAHFSGTGGDNVFCYLQSSRPFADRLLREGPGAAWITLRDLSMMTGASTPTIARDGLTRLMPQRRSYQWRGDPSFLNSDMMGSVPLELRHPWLQLPPKGLPGRALHSVLLLRIQNYLEQHFLPGLPPKIAPLMSQPIMEFCLSLPTWVWCEGGQNRSLARQAFAKSLPSEIISRRSKGGPDNFSLAVFDCYSSAIRELLLDGAMAKAGLLDKAAIETALEHGRPTKASSKLRILALTDAEAWVRNWVD